MRGLTLLLLLLAAVPARAGTFAGSVEIQQPLGTPDRPQDDSAMFVARLQMPRLLGRWGMHGEVKHQLKRGAPFDRESQLTLGVDRTLGSGLTVFVDWNRRYSVEADRVYGGVRWSFRGIY